MINQDRRTREALVHLRSAAAYFGLEVPADIEKRIESVPEGAIWDASRALAVWAPEALADGTVAFGELALNGQFRRSRGVLFLLRGVAARRVLVGPHDEAEARLGPKPVHVVWDLEELLQEARSPSRPAEPQATPKLGKAPVVVEGGKMTDILFGVLEGAVKRGRLRVLFVGPPGCGKTLAARWLHQAWPHELTPEQLMDLNTTYSLAGLWQPELPAPFRAPHHSVSEAGVFGMGRTGELDLAEHGMLYFDELPEFRTSILQQLVERKDRLPHLVGGANPCPCGYHGHPRRECRCSEKSIALWERTLDIVRPLFDVEIRLPALELRS